MMYALYLAAYALCPTPPPSLQTTMRMPYAIHCRPLYDTWAQDVASAISNPSVNMYRICFSCIVMIYFNT